MSRAAAEAVAEAAESPAIRILDRSAILSVTDLQRELVEVPEWGGSVYIQGLSGTDRDAFERSMMNLGGKEVTVKWDNFRAKLLARCIVDSEGTRLFSDGDVALLGKKNGAVISRLYDIAQRLSGMREEDVKEIVEDLKEDPSEGSGSD